MEHYVDVGLTLLLLCPFLMLGGLFLFSVCRRGLRRCTLLSDDDVLRLYGITNDRASKYQSN